LLEELIGRAEELLDDGGRLDMRSRRRDEGPISLCVSYAATDRKDAVRRSPSSLRLTQLKRTVDRLDGWFLAASEPGVVKFEIILPTRGPIETV
jgi:hypothetical protein